MLSDREKKAIELLEDYLICGNKEGVLYRNLRIIFRIIEKQSKQTEELKEKNKITKQMNENLIEVLKGSISIDKIKETIEDILNSENSEAIEKLIEWQSLLEKED